METTETKKKTNAVNESIVREIAKCLQGLAFGNITIKVHNSKIVQLEVTENKRFDDKWVTPSGDGI